MSQPLFVFLAVLIALPTGAAVGWLLASARARAASAAARIAALQASTTLQIELSSVKVKAFRVPELERDLAAALQSLNSANERKAALESEVLALTGAREPPRPDCGGAGACGRLGRGTSRIDQSAHCGAFGGAEQSRGPSSTTRGDRIALAGKECRGHHTGR